MFINAASSLVFYMYKFVLNPFICYYISFLPARVAANSIKRIRVSGWFVRMEITTAHPILTITLKNTLRTSEAKILKGFKSIQPEPKN